MTLWSVEAAATLGRDHAVLRRNRQDAAAAGATREGAFGVVSDGCGEGSASEVGALLTVALARAALARGLACELGLDVIARLAADEVELGLAKLARSIPQQGRTAFVHDHLLATLVGFVVRGREAVLFAAGDGVWLANGSARVLEQGNRPLYPAYGLAGTRVPLLIEHVHGVDSVAVSTDGLEPAELHVLSHPAPAALGRRLVLLQRDGALSDDGAIAIAMRGEPCAC
jgi:hypothetical protein